MHKAICSSYLGLYCASVNVPHAEPFSTWADKGTLREVRSIACDSNRMDPNEISKTQSHKHKRVHKHKDVCVRVRVHVGVLYIP